jgi:hypothetical protein
MLKECGLCPVFAGFTLAFALLLRKKHGKKNSVRVAEDCQLAPLIRIQYLREKCVSVAIFCKLKDVCEQKFGEQWHNLWPCSGL